MSFTKPETITEPFCAQGIEGTDYVTPQVSSTDPLVVTQDLGYPPSQATPYQSGGTFVTRPQTNGLLRLYSNIITWLNIGGQITFDDAVVDVGGYPEGIVLWCASNGTYQKSLKDNNIANFITTPSYINDGINWRVVTNTPSITNLSRDVLEILCVKGDYQASFAMLPTFDTHPQVINRMEFSLDNNGGRSPQLGTTIEGKWRANDDGTPSAVLDINVGQNDRSKFIITSEAINNKSNTTFQCSTDGSTYAMNFIADTLPTITVLDGSPVQSPDTIATLKDIGDGQYVRFDAVESIGFTSVAVFDKNNNIWGVTISGSLPIYRVDNTYTWARSLNLDHFITSGGWDLYFDGIMSISKLPLELVIAQQNVYVRKFSGLNPTLNITIEFIPGSINIPNPIIVSFSVLFIACSVVR